MSDVDNETEQPEILEANWDREQVVALFDDLRDGAEVTHAQVRAASEHGPRDIAVNLSQARQLFDDGDAKAIQIRYKFDGQSWCDTVMVLGDEYRIIRTTDPH